MATPAPRPRAYLTTALREAKASLRGAGPSAGPMLRSQSPDLVRQELAAWAAATEMTRGVARAAALAASPAKKGRRAGMPVQAREISHGRTRRAVTAAIRTGRTSYTALTRELAKYRTVIDRNRHRPRKAKCASTFPRAAAPAPPPGSPRPSSPSPTRPPDQHRRRKPGQHDQPAGPWSRPSPGTTCRPSACPQPEITHRYQNRETRTSTQMPKAHGIGILPQSGEISRSVFKCRENRGDITCLGARARA